MPRIRFMERSFRAPEEKGKIRHKFYMILNTHHAVLLNNDQLSHSPRQTIPWQAQSLSTEKRKKKNLKEQKRRENEDDFKHLYKISGNKPFKSEKQCYREKKVKMPSYT